MPLFRLETNVPRSKITPEFLDLTRTVLSETIGREKEPWVAASQPAFRPVDVLIARQCWPQITLVSRWSEVMGILSRSSHLSPACIFAVMFCLAVYQDQAQVIRDIAAPGISDSNPCTRKTSPGYLERIKH
uniref:Uncharacterized protein n=1 Tax=Timema genevievae TaxID=629358 RepID=A0A7R9K612_TIMGE|nr:unnamed protein product [Timema genevievae]